MLGDRGASGAWGGCWLLWERRHARLLPSGERADKPVNAAVAVVL